MTTEDEFQARLDAEPDNHTVRLVFADWLDDRSDPRADGYRALGSLQLWPWYFRDSRDWGWWSKENWPDIDKPQSTLPDDWYEVMRIYDCVGLKRAEAENAAAMGFTRLPAGRRTELLNASRTVAS